MKKLLLLLLILPLAFVACSDDDDNVNEKDLIGTWNYAQTKASVSTQNDKDNKLAQLIKEIMIAEEDIDLVSITFNEDGTFSEAYSDTEDNDQGTYVIKDNKLTLTFDEDGDIFKIIMKVETLNKTSLRLSADITDDIKEEFDTESEEFIEAFGNASIKSVISTASFVKK